MVGTRPGPDLAQAWPAPLEVCEEKGESHHRTWPGAYLGLGDARAPTTSYSDCEI